MVKSEASQDLTSAVRREEQTATSALPIARESAATRLDQIMDRYARGDEAVFGELWGTLGPRVHGFLRRICGNRELARDLTQETFMRIHKARGAFAPGRSVVPWAYAIARNCYLSHGRANRNRPVYAPYEPTEVSAESDSSAEEVTIAKQTALIVERELRAMTEVRREAFVLLRYEGLSVAEAAAVLGITESALKVRAFHAYEAIRKALDTSASSSQTAPPTSASRTPAP